MTEQQLEFLKRTTELGGIPSIRSNTHYHWEAYKAMLSFASKAQLLNAHYDNEEILEETNTNIGASGLYHDDETQYLHDNATKAKMYLYDEMYRRDIIKPQSWVQESEERKKEAQEFMDELKNL